VTPPRSGPAPDFDHFLLTRFSAVLTPGAPPAGADWLRYRLGFFYDATLPSVVSQTGALSEWLVLFDDRCPDDFRADVEDLAREGRFTPVWSHEPFRRDTFAGLVATLSRAPYLITTRLDSDDAIARDHLAAVQARFARQDRLFVNFVRGLQVDRGGAVYRSDQVSNPFLSLIERRTDGPPLTVYAPRHARARGHGPVLNVHAPPMWLQVVHDGNLLNMVTGPQIAPAVVRERFDIDLGYREQVGRLRLLGERIRHRTRLTRMWLAHPGEATRYAEARLTRWRRDHTVPQGDPDSLGDRLRRRAVRLGYRPRT